jgi:hypothetical protein
MKRVKKSQKPLTKRVFSLPVKHTDLKKSAHYKLRAFVRGAFLFLPQCSRKIEAHGAHKLLHQIIKKLIPLSILLIQIVPVNSESDCLQCYKIKKTSFTYTLDITYKSQVSVNTLFSFFYDSSSVRKLNTFYDSIKYRTIDSNNYEIATFFHYLRFKGYAYYTKTAHKKNDSISIILNYFTHNWTKIPRITKGETDIKIERVPDGNLIKYEQQITVDKKIGWFESNMLHWHSERFSKHFFAVMKRIRD